MGLFARLFPDKKTNYQQLQSAWSQRHTTLKQKLLTKHKESIDWLAQNMPAKEHLAAGSLSGLLLLAPPVLHVLPATTSASTKPIDTPLQLSDQTVLLNDLAPIVPTDVRPLTPDEEQKITGVLTKHLGTEVTAEINGIRLERNYGLIGAEQHLVRFPGDTIWSQLQTPEDVANYASSGMAPGRGAWGYFAPSEAEMTPEESDREKYYIAVQTFMAPGFAQNVREYSEFFKYRKMLIVNPQNGKAMIVDIGDSGPAVWTGKQLGGSPEVMKYLDRKDGAAKGPVLYFFINDPNDKIPLGPITI
ncbi:MAG TPA: hypothetical protein VG935_01425 [Patescibacteria group bacterium]|nr:hypothetical protein [Patescibacteria group bacterium]